MSPKNTIVLNLIFIFFALYNQIFANWFYDGSLHTKIGYDDNGLVSSDTSPQKEASSFSSTHIDLLAQYQIASGDFFSVRYSPSSTHYFGLDQDDHLAHTSVLKFKKSTLDNFIIKGSLLYKFIDGDTLTPCYTETSPTFLGGLAIRDRHKAVISRQSLDMQWNFNEHSLFSIVFEGYYHDFRTTQFRSSDPERPDGYINYIDRSIFNGGFNIGYKFLGDAYLLGGYRYGIGKQDNRPDTDLHYSNYFHRILIGIQGKINHGVTFDLFTGPELKEFTGKTAEGFGHTRTFWFAKGSVQIDLQNKGKLKLSISRLPLQSYLGASIYEDFKIQATYSKKLDDSLTASATFTRYEGDWVSRQHISRNDLLWSPAISLKYQIRNNLLLDLNYTYESTESVVKNQEFERNLLSLGATFTF